MQNSFYISIFFGIFLCVSCSSRVSPNVLGLCEVAENRSEKFQFRPHVAKANFHLLNYEKKPIKLAFADYEAQNFQLSLNPPFCKTLVLVAQLKYTKNLYKNWIFRKFKYARKEEFYTPIICFGQFVGHGSRG